MVLVPVFRDGKPLFWRESEEANPGITFAEDPCTCKKCPKRPPTYDYCACSCSEWNDAFVAASEAVGIVVNASGYVDCHKDIPCGFDFETDETIYFPYDINWSALNGSWNVGTGILNLGTLGNTSDRGMEIGRGWKAYPFDPCREWRLYLYQIVGGIHCVGIGPNFLEGGAEFRIQAFWENTGAFVSLGDAGIGTTPGSMSETFPWDEICDGAGRDVTPSESYFWSDGTCDDSTVTLSVYAETGFECPEA